MFRLKPSLSLSGILLPTLLVPFIMTYRLSPGDTPYWLFGLIFLALLLYLILDICRFDKKIYYKFKYILFWFIIVSSIGSAFFAAIIVRHETAPVYMVHDIILQLESAIQFFLSGQNPYAVTYFGTPLEQWSYGEGLNPALYHFVMQPFYLLFSIPFYFISITFFGFFDGRISLYFLFFVVLILAFFMIKEGEKKLLFVTVLAFNPAMLPYTLEGRSDIFMFTFLFLSLYLLYKNRLSLSGVPMALAFAVKQSAWPILPFYIVFVYLALRVSQHTRDKPSREARPEHSRRVLDIARTVKILLPFILTFFLITLPFFLWNPSAFLDSTVLYLSGTAPNSYPISGYGLGMLLHQLGIVKDLNNYYPFHLWQFVICLPLAIVLVKYLKQNPSVKRLITVYGIFLFVFWYLSRYFNNSHLAYLSTVFITAYFWPEDMNTS